MPERLNRLLLRLDRTQQRYRPTAFVFGVIKKFGDDSAGQLAALISYYAFVSLFPLLLVLVTVLGFVMRNRPNLQRDILDSALTQFPIIGDQIRDNVGSLRGSGIGLVIGLVGALYGGLGVARAAQNALNEVWDVPIRTRPGFLKAVARSLLIIGVIGGGLLATTVVSGLGSGTGALGAGLRIAAFAASLVLNFVLFAAAFRILTAVDLTWRDVLPGAAVAAVAWQILQVVGTYVVTRQLKGTSQTAGLFAVVLGLLSWLYLQSQVLLFAAEINVVRARKLWPRRLVAQAPLTDADRRALRDYADVEERVPEENVQAHIRHTAGTGSAPETHGSHGRGNG